MPEIPRTTPISRSVAVSPAASAGETATSAERVVASDEARSRSDAAIFVDAEETLRMYRENILLVGEALLTLELMERGALEESQRRIDTLTESFPDKESALLIHTLLSHWLTRARTVRGEPVAETTVEPRIASRPEALESTDKTVAALKREGLNFYSRGDLSGAVSCWRRILELDPADRETRQFLQRAEAILKNRRAG